MGGQQPTARQAISNNTQKLQALHFRFCYDSHFFSDLDLHKNTFVVGTLDDFKPQVDT